MTWLVSHQHNGAPKTTSHTTEHAAEVEVRRVAASLPLGTQVVLWEIDESQGCDFTTAPVSAREGQSGTRCHGGDEPPYWNDPMRRGETS